MRVEFSIMQSPTLFKDDTATATD